MLKQADITATLKSIPWFLELSPESIERLAAIAEIHAFDPDEVIFSEGEQHPFFYVILEGEVLLESFIPGYGTLPIFTAESLDVIGWSSLTPVVRQKTSTAQVIKRAVLLTFQADRLMKICESDCDLGFIIMRRLANIVASRMLNHRLHLMRLITSQNE